MNTFVIKYREYNPKTEKTNNFEVIWNSEDSEKAAEDFEKSFDKKDFKNIMGYGVYPIAPYPEIAFVAVQ